MVKKNKSHLILFVDEGCGLKRDPLERHITYGNPSTSRQREEILKIRSFRWRNVGLTLDSKWLGKKVFVFESQIHAQKLEGVVIKLFWAIMNIIIAETLFSSTTAFQRGIIAGLLAICLTAILEVVTSIPHIRLLRSTSEGRNLYRSALLANALNNLVFGPLTYYFTITHVCRQADETTPVPSSFVQSMVEVVGILVIEGVLYYLVHKAFHEVKGLYWMHKYHHQFHNVVTPCAANAVSIAEYLVAYMLPIVVGVAITQADEISTFLASTVIAVTNLLIHTPSLDEHKILGGLGGLGGWCWILVSPTDHMNHHRTSPKGNYSAPVFHFDRIFAKLLVPLEVPQKSTDN